MCACMLVNLYVHLLHFEKTKLGLQMHGVMLLKCLTWRRRFLLCVHQDERGSAAYS